MARCVPATARSLKSPFYRLCLATSIPTPFESLIVSKSTCSFLTRLPKRTIYAYAKAKPTQSRNALPQSITQTLDESIGATRAHLVGNDNKLLEAESLKVLLSKIDRTTQHLRKVGESPDGVPIVRVVLRESLLQAQREKMAVPKKVDVADTAKQVELNWAVSENDLNHRLKKMKEFLSAGKHLEVMIAPKRKGRKATPEEIKSVLERIKECIGEVEGATEWKAQTGVPGKVMELYFKGAGPKVDREQLMQERNDKLKKKEEEKAERRRKEEARLKEKEEEQRQAAQERERLLKEIELGRQRQKSAQT